MAAYTAEQYRFIVLRLARGMPAASIVREFRWKDTTCTVDDVCALDRPYLSPDWQGVYDKEQAAYKNRALVDPEMQIAALVERLEDAIDRKDDCAILKFTELLAKLQGRFFHSKAVPVSGDGDQGATFTFGLDRASEN